MSINEKAQVHRPPTTSTGPREGAVAGCRRSHLDGGVSIKTREDLSHPLAERSPSRLGRDLERVVSLGDK